MHEVGGASPSLPTKINNYWEIAQVVERVYNEKSNPAFDLSRLVFTKVTTIKTLANFMGYL